MREQKREEHFIAGMTGAFLGSFVGAACIVLVGQLGYTASFCGVIMAVCALRGYRRFAGVLSRKGILFSSCLILAMTYMANKLQYALLVSEAGEMDVFAAFRSLDALLEKGVLDTSAYFADLALLYLFTLLGAVPSLFAAYGQSRKEAREEERRGYTQTDGYAQTNGYAQPRQRIGASFPGREAVEPTQYYPAAAGWMRRLRFSLCIPLLVLCLLICGLAIGHTLVPEQLRPVFLGQMIGIFAALLLLTLAALLLFAPCFAWQWIFVRRIGKIWRVDLARLNAIKTYHFTQGIHMRKEILWEKLSDEEKSRAKYAIERAIQSVAAERTAPDSALGRCVLCLEKLQPEWENPWAWHVSYEPAKIGTKANPSTVWRKRMTIAKAYPGFAPAPGLEPPRGPAPAHAGFIIITLVLTAIFAGGGAFAGAVAGGGTLMEGASSVFASAKKAGAQEPESVLSYEQKGVTFQIDSRLARMGDGEFADPDTGTVYRITVSLGQTRESALDALTEPIGQHRMDAGFEGFSFNNTETEDGLAEFTAEDQVIYLHNLLTVTFSDGRSLLNAVSFAENAAGTLFRVEADCPEAEDEEAAKAVILYLLRNVKQTGPTDANYRSMYHQGGEMGYEHVGIAFIVSPYGGSQYMRIPLPYGGEVEYGEDGTSVRSQAHGLRIFAEAFYSPEGPQPIVDRAYEEIVESGLELYDEGVFETRYDGEVDMASKQISFWEGENARISFLVAQPLRREGYYRYMEVTYIPEEMDGVYGEMIAELREACDLELPELPKF